MNEAPALVLAGVMGALFGAFYYGGLWLTVRTAVTSKHAALQVLASTLLRTVLAVSGFFLISRSHWERLVPCLMGFFLASVAFTRWAPAPIAKRSHRAEGATDASQS